MTTYEKYLARQKEVMETEEYKERETRIAEMSEKIAAELAKLPKPEPHVPDINESRRQIDIMQQTLPDYYGEV